MNRVIVITGAAGGFGSAVVRKIAPSGPKLALADMNEESLSSLAEEARSLGAEVVSKVTNTCDEASVASLFDAVKEAYGQADVLLNLPGLSVAAPIAEMAVEDYDKIVDVNLKGLFLAAKHFTNATVADRNPQLLLISSMAATRANPNAPVYCAAKAAVSMFAQGYALQAMKNDIRVTTIKPGPTSTKGFWGDRPVPHEKFMQTEDVANVIEFILNQPPHIVMHEICFESFAFFKK